MTSFHIRYFSTLNYARLVASNLTGSRINTKRRAVDISVPTKLLVQMKDGFSPLITDITETDVTGQQPITIEEGTSSRAACGAAIRTVLAVFMVRAGFRDRLGWRVLHRALQTIGLTSFP